MWRLSNKNVWCIDVHRRNEEVSEEDKSCGKFSPIRRREFLFQV